MQTKAVHGYFRLNETGKSQKLFKPPPYIKPYEKNADRHGFCVSNGVEYFQKHEPIVTKTAEGGFFVEDGKERLLCKVDPKVCILYVYRGMNAEFPEYNLVDVDCDGTVERLNAENGAVNFELEEGALEKKANAQLGAFYAR